MSVITAPPKTSCSEELTGWMRQRFETNGTSIERLVLAAADQFGPDAAWMRRFVLEQFREIAIAALNNRPTPAIGSRAGEPWIDLPEPAPLPPKPVPAAKPVDPDRAPAKRKVLAAAKSESKTPAWAKALAIDPTTCGVSTRAEPGYPTIRGNPRCGESPRATYPQQAPVARPELRSGPDRPGHRREKGGRI